MESTYTAVAQTIADQIGRRAFVMLGARNLLACNDEQGALQFDVGSNARRVTRVRITLNPGDLYDVETYTGRGLNLRRIGMVPDVYAENLRGVLAAETGMAVSL